MTLLTYGHDPCIVPSSPVASMPRAKRDPSAVDALPPLEYQHSEYFRELESTTAASEGIPHMQIKEYLSKFLSDATYDPMQPQAWFSNALVLKRREARANQAQTPVKKRPIWRI